MNSETTVTNFIMLIGPWELARQRLNSEEPNLQLNAKYNFSLSPFKANEQHLFANFKDFHIDYLDDLSADIKTSISEHFGSSDCSAYKKYIKENNIEATDIQLSIPPCAGLSLLNNGNRGADNKANGWMYETVKWFISQGNKVLCLENAPGLLGKEGLSVLKNVEKILKDNGVEKEYKFHLTKTSTTQHGIPQHRTRAFLYLYKSNEHIILKNIKHKTPTVEAWLERYPNENDESIDHVPLKDNWASVFIDFINEKGDWQRFRDLTKSDNDTKVISCWPTWLEEYKKDPNYFGDRTKNLKRAADKMLKKLEVGLGYWDSSPNFIRGRINAIVAKNSYNTVHPKYDRYLTIRELMSLMGYPDSYRLVNVQKNFNAICQSLPVCTGMDHIRWAYGIAKRDPKYVGETVKTPHTLLMQHKMKSDLENSLFSCEFEMPWNSFKKERKSSLKSFVK